MGLFTKECCQHNSRHDASVNSGVFPTIRTLRRGSKAEFTTKKKVLWHWEVYFCWLRPFQSVTELFIFFRHEAMKDRQQQSFMRQSLSDLNESDYLWCDYDCCKSVGFPPTAFSSLLYYSRCIRPAAAFCLTPPPSLSSLSISFYLMVYWHSELSLSRPHYGSLSLFLSISSCQSALAATRHWSILNKR